MRGLKEDWEEQEQREKAAKAYRGNCCNYWLHLKRKVGKDGPIHPALTHTPTQGSWLCIRDGEVVLLLWFADPAAVAHLLQRTEEALLGLLVLHGCFLCF